MAASISPDDVSLLSPGCGQGTFASSCAPAVAVPTMVDSNHVGPSVDDVLLDYCNVLYMGLPLKMVQKLQLV